MSRAISSHILFGDEVDGFCSGTFAHSPAPTVYTGAKFSGTLFIISCGVHRCAFDTVQLTLKGEVKTRVQKTGSIVKKVERILIHMTCVKLATDFRRTHCTGSVSMGHETNFFFDLPEFVTVPSDEAFLPRRLPPSISVSKCGPHAVGSNCDVSYFMEARILTGDKLVCYSSREILVLPATEIPPPLDPADLKNEFRMTGSSEFGSFWSSTRSTTILVSSTEPRPLVFPTAKGEYGSTAVILNFKTRGSCPESQRNAGPQLNDCDIVITLEAITYFLEQESQSMMSTDEALESPRTVLKKTTFKTERRHIHLRKWKKGRHIGDSTTGRLNLIEWETSASMPIVLPEDFSRLPSFFSALIARRYAINLQIILGTKYSIASSKPIKLRIPVQIIHSPTRKSAIAHSAAEVEDLDAPPYVGRA